MTAFTKEWPCSYYVIFGRGDASDYIPIEVPCFKTEYELLKSYYYFILGEDEEGNEIDYDNPRFENLCDEPEDDAALERFARRALKMAVDQAKMDAEEYMPESDFENYETRINLVDTDIDIE